MADFKSPAGKYAGAESGQKGGGTREGGKPAAGITNDSRGNLAPRGPGKGVPANGTRIR